MQKTPDEIKKGLATCSADECHGQHTDCPYHPELMCIRNICGDALALIQQLEAQNTEKDARIKQLEAERDAAVADLAHVKDCDTCKYDDACLTGKKDCFGCHEESCPCLHCKYEWRGVQKEGEHS